MRLAFFLTLALLSATAWPKCKDQDPHNKAGQRHGTLVYCTSGEGREETTYVNGVEDGLKRIYDSEGKLQSEISYRGGKHNGPMKKWHSNGKLSFEGTYKDWKQTGVSKQYSEEGHLMLSETHADGKLNGERRKYHDNGKHGKIEVIESYKADKKDGKWQEFWENGKLREVTHWANDERTGEHLQYDEKAQLKLQETLRDNQNDGWKLEWYDNSDGYYLANARFDKMGKSVVYATFYANGKLNDVTCYDKDGNSSNDRGPCKPYLKDLEKKTGKQTVAVVEDEAGGFYENGKPKSKCGSKDGKRHGKCFRYLENGTVIWSGEYDRGVPNGDVSEFYESGKPRKVSTYKSGKLTRIAEYFDEGQLQKTTEVKDDREIASKTLFQNGEVKEEIEWKGDRQHYREYYDNGKLAVKAVLVPNTSCRYGCWTTHQYEGTVERYTEKGKLYAKGDWKEGMRHGKHFTFSDNGKLREEEVYENDRLVSEKRYSRSGKLEKWVEYFKDGSKKIKKGS